MVRKNGLVHITVPIGATFTNLYQLFILTDATWWILSLTYISCFRDQSQNGNRGAPVMFPITIMSSYIKYKLRNNLE